MQLGFKLIAEAFPPQEIVRQAVAAEEAGFDFVEVSDHYHPWLYSQQHSGFAWSMLAAAAARTERIGLASGATCPSIRYHPAIIAQAAATTALLADGRFTLGLGSGERLNEHVVGHAWASVSVRHEMFREAIEIIRLLWSGGYRSYQAGTCRWTTHGSSTCPTSCRRSSSRWVASAPSPWLPSWPTASSPPSRSRS